MGERVQTPPPKSPAPPVPTKKSDKTTVTQVRSSKNKRKLVVVTAYDYTYAKLVDPLIDITLVGDSLGMVIQGKRNTLSVTVDDMIYHSRAVAQAVNHSLLVVDMPFMSYQTGVQDAVRNAGRLVSEGCAESVKLEGGTAVVDIVARLVHIGVPVLGHIGLTPQSVHVFGGFKVQGKTEQAKNSILQDALALEDAGAYAIVLEGIPSDLAKRISEQVSIPTIGIGAGPHCDGQVLVSQDLLGLDPEFRPKFVKRYADLGNSVRNAVSDFAKEVRTGKFPDNAHSFH